MPHPVRDILAASAAAIVAFAAIPLFAQTGAGLLEGTAAFGDWHGDHPGVRRIIRPQDLPAPNTAESARNFVREVRRTDQKPIVPNGFEVNLFASGLAEPRIIRVAPNGDVFVAESSAGRIRVLRPGGNGAARAEHVRIGPALPVRHRVLSGRSPIRNGSMSATPMPWSAFPIAMAISPRAARPRSWCRICRSAATAPATWCSRRTARQCMCRSAPARTPATAWRS